jgi:hypothetical protein
LVQEMKENTAEVKQEVAAEVNQAEGANTAAPVVLTLTDLCEELATVQAAQLGRLSKMDEALSVLEALNTQFEQLEAKEKALRLELRKVRARALRR